jgi:hypothetical protein
MAGLGSGCELPHIRIAQRHLMPNNTFERTVEHRGPRLAAARAPWPAAQLDREASWLPSVCQRWPKNLKAGPRVSLRRSRVS